VVTVLFLKRKGSGSIMSSANLAGFRFGPNLKLFSNHGLMKIDFFPEIPFKGNVY
jgi:hypothetical protein